MGTKIPHDEKHIGINDMAYIEQSPSGKWRAQVQVDGVRKSKSFATKADAQIWAKTMEKAKPTATASKILFKDFLDEYEVKTAKYKKSAHWEIIRLNAFRRHPLLSTLPLNLISKQVLQDWVRERLETVVNGRKIKSSTVAREMTIFKALFTKAVDWGYLERSPVADITVKVNEQHRERVATEEEIEMLKAIVEWEEDEEPVDIQQRVIAAFIFACYTGMRINEIVKLERSWVTDHVITIPNRTKTGPGRKVAVPDRAWNILQIVLSMGIEPRPWGLEQGQHDAIFRKTRNRAGLIPTYDSAGYMGQEGLNFHDSRATFCTWAASPGPDGAPRLDVLALARQTGHKNISQLMTYYRKDATELLNRLK